MSSVFELGLTKCRFWSKKRSALIIGKPKRPKVFEKLKKNPYIFEKTQVPLENGRAEKNLQRSLILTYKALKARTPDSLKQRFKAFERKQPMCLDLLVTQRKI